MDNEFCIQNKEVNIFKRNMFWVFAITDNIFEDKIVNQIYSTKNIKLDISPKSISNATIKQ